ncbi:hypothetical protein CMO93_02230 [Candidatus Woesearchaeota archaeon]|nr:hypothetical protein [Candidatus Woesearchaeota archaeon]|tara:strand:+ start:1243 stop:1437 length:195 start_codon:yes stop_codon:yes gene_type:complete
MKMNKVIFVIFVFMLLFSYGCTDKEAKKQEEYNKCASVCASVLGEDFVTMELCREECQKKFLEE